MVPVVICGEEAARNLFREWNKAPIRGKERDSKSYYRVASFKIDHRLSCRIRQTQNSQIKYNSPSLLTIINPHEASIAVLTPIKFALHQNTSQMLRPRKYLSSNSNMSSCWISCLTDGVEITVNLSINKSKCVSWHILTADIHKVHLTEHTIRVLYAGSICFTNSWLRKNNQ